jgi:hypothetical protein
MRAKYHHSLFSCSFVSKARSSDPNPTPKKAARKGDRQDPLEASSLTNAEKKSLKQEWRTRYLQAFQEAADSGIPKTVGTNETQEKMTRKCLSGTGLRHRSGQCS